jgi:hypothetical protein
VFHNKSFFFDLIICIKIKVNVLLLIFYEPWNQLLFVRPITSRQATLLRRFRPQTTSVPLVS